MSFEDSAEKKGARRQVTWVASVLCAVLGGIRLGVVGPAALDVDLARWLFESSPLLGQLQGWLVFGAVAWILETLAVGTTAWVSTFVLPRLGYDRRYVLALNVASVVVFHAVLMVLPRWPR